VFGEEEISDAQGVLTNWERLKAEERAESGKSDASALDGVALALPALSQAMEYLNRAARVGFDWPDVSGPLEKLVEELTEFAGASGASEREDEFGDVLFVVVNIADHLGINAEQALRVANQKFRRRFGQLEAIARDEGVDLKALDLPGLDSLWERAKAEETR
jgi:MazG family protein